MQDAINGQAAFEALVRENERLPLVTHPERKAETTSAISSSPISGSAKGKND
jgi:hypothetical protein